jgi:steroid delta-isomerase-like uncharacterized protein
MATTGLEKQFESASVTQGMFEAWNDGDFDRLVALMAEDIEWHDVPTGQVIRGQDNFRRYAETWLTAMPDSRPEVVNAIVTDEWEVFEGVTRTANSGPMADLIGQEPAAGRSFGFRFCFVNHIRDGRIDRCTCYFDMSPLLR